MTASALILFLVTTTVAAPDVTIDQLGVTITAKEVELVAKIRNSTGEPAASVTLSLFVDSATEPGPGATPSHSWEIAPLPALGTWTGKLNAPKPENGEHIAWARATLTGDPTPDNNVKSTPYTIGAGPGALPNLMVSGFTVTHGYEILNYKVKVSNQGTVAAQNVEVDVFYSMASAPDCWAGALDADYHHDAMIDSIGPGEEVALPFMWIKPPEGPHQSWVSIDCMGYVAETLETDNVGGPLAVTYDPTIVPVDLRATKAEVSAVDCSSAIFSLTITNGGDVAAGPFDVDLFESEPAQSAGLVPDARWPIPGLAGGESIDLQHLASEVPAGVHNALLVIDSGLAIEETYYPEIGPNLGESNNFVPIEVNLGVSSCPCPHGAVSEPCDCGGSFVSGGFCCNGVWSAKVCPGTPPPPPDTAGPQNPEPSVPAPDVGTPQNPEASAPGADAGGRGPRNPDASGTDPLYQPGGTPPPADDDSGGCSTGPSDPSGPLGTLLVLFGAVALIGIRRWGL